ncbi:hypothetical protein F01_140258 [Burkholderia cenocepacia]|nr:hypothetical protein F01_140258 [Burkholderia cenocepacia]
MLVECLHSEWVFTSNRSEDGKIGEPPKAHNGAIEAAGLPHLTSHCIARTAPIVRYALRMG